MNQITTKIDQLYLSEAAIFLSRYQPREIKSNKLGNKNTYSTYKRAIHQFYSWLVGSGISDISKVKLQQLNMYQEDLLTSYKPKTTQVYLSVLSEFYAFMFNRKAISNNEFANLKIISIDKRENKGITLTETELTKLLKYVRSLDNSPSNTVNKLIMVILANTGVRESELCNIKIGDMVYQKDNLVINIKGKGMRKRFVVLSDKISHEVIQLKELLENAVFRPLNNDDYLIQAISNNKPKKMYNPLDRSNINRRLTNISKAVKIDFTPHSLRRSLATNLYKKGTPVEVISRVLGHENITTTQGYIASFIDKEVGVKYATSY